MYHCFSRMSIFFWVTTVVANPRYQQVFACTRATPLARARPGSRSGCRLVHSNPGGSPRDWWGASRCIHKMSGLNIPGLKHVENIWKLKMSEASSMFLFLVIHAMWVAWFACVDCVIGRFCKAVRGRTNIWAACFSKKVKCVASSVHKGSLTYKVYHSYSRSKI